jgi:Fe2+ transport system protein FeoA
MQKLLSELKKGEKGTIVSISRDMNPEQKRRLFDLGFVPGSVIENRFSNVSGNPIAYFIRNTTIALRKEHASRITVDV